MFSKTNNHNGNSGFILRLQDNKSKRDYIYEISVQYLIARAIHLSCQLGLAEKILQSNITIEALCALLPQYNTAAITDLVEFLASYNLLEVTSDKRLLPTDYTKGLLNLNEKVMNEDDWRESYQIFDYIQANDEIYKLFDQTTKVMVDNGVLNYSSQNVQAIVQELALGHIIARCVRACATLGLFDKIAACNNKTTVAELIDYVNAKIQPNTNINIGIEKVISLLARYGILHYCTETNTISSTDYAIYLCDTPESLLPAMYMIDERWWGAASKIASSFQRDSKSAFEDYNKATFYDCYLKGGSPIFPKGMAAISLFEDADVANAIENEVSKQDTIVDIGGGDAGLLFRLFEKFGHQKKYVLFEKAPNISGEYVQEVKRLEQRIIERFGHDFMPYIILGDFNTNYNENSIPKIENAAYIIKCVLHNIKDPKVITNILDNVNAVMGNDSPLLIAERIVPDVHRPHINRGGNFLMRLLFKANSRTIEFYRQVFSEAKLSTDAVLDAGNYAVMKNTIKHTAPLRLFEGSKCQDTSLDGVKQHQASNTMKHMVP